jgi:hypothetical protein
MAWFANPFAYLTINTVVAFGPVIAKSLSLSPRYAGYFCSVWMFVRTASFVLLWLWPAWHYRFRWMVAAYLGMMFTFVSILLSPNVPALILAQIGFGFSIGLIYYSSLFYSMDVGETKGEHGGFHEAAIGLGSSAGLLSARRFCIWLRKYSMPLPKRSEWFSCWASSACFGCAGAAHAFSGRSETLESSAMQFRESSELRQRVSPFLERKRYARTGQRRAINRHHHLDRPCGVSSAADWIIGRSD